MPQAPQLGQLRHCRSGQAALAVLLAVLATPLAAQEARDFSAASARVAHGSDRAPLTGPSNATRPQIVIGFLRTRHAQPTLDTLVVEREHRAANGVTHVQFKQRVGGLDVYGTYARAAIDARGRILSLVENLADARAALVPGIGSPGNALESVLGEFYPGIAADLTERTAAGETVTFAAGQRFAEDHAVTRVAVPMANGAMIAGYLVVTWDRENTLRHTVVGPGGRLLLSELRTSRDSYKVFEKNPGVAPQVVVAGPGAGNTESPIGWVSGNTTTGNNVDAYLDRDNNNKPDTGGRPTSLTKDFLFTADLTQAPATVANQMAAVTNLFYLSNVVHDKLYRHGFTESAGNFQANNFGNGGIANDPLLAEAQDSGGINNATFATPLDGTKPRMQVYLWNASAPERDGALDSDVVWHEHGHGLTWRMIGNMTGPLAGAVAEGVGDMLATFINRKDVVGEYVANNPNGIRRHPYTNYPLTYGGIAGQSVHDDGEVYAATMWKLLELWEGDGRSQDSLFDVVINGMNFTPAQPSFEHMRDGLIAAAATPGEDCLIWRAFARYGIGQGASGSASCNFFGCQMFVTESLAIPAACSVGGSAPPVVAITAPANGTSHPQGTSVAFSGTATDDGANISGSLIWTSSLDGPIGTGAAFSTTALSVGTHTITASATDGDGLSASDSISTTITVGGGPQITLSLAGRRSKSINFVDLTWSGATTSHVDIWRDGVKIQTQTNGGFYSDNTRTKGSQTFTYKVCEINSTIICSPLRTITF